MKLLILMLPLITLSQKQVRIEPVLEPYVIEFVNEAQKRDLYLMDLVLKLDSISIYPINKGWAVYTGKSILVHPLTLKNTYRARVVIFHELFHSLGLFHCHNVCDDIMGSNFPINYDYSLFGNDVFWQRKLDKEFKKL